MREQEANEALLKQKYQDARAQMAESEATVQNMKSSIKQVELQLSHSKKLCEELLREKETMKNEARKEVQKDLSNMQKDREREIERIYCRLVQNYTEIRITCCNEALCFQSPAGNRQEGYNHRQFTEGSCFAER